MNIIRYLIVGCALLSVVALRAETSGQEGTVVAVKGSVTVSGAGGASGNARTGSKVVQGTRFVSGAGSEATIRFFDGTVAVIQADSEVIVEALTRTTDTGRVTKETVTLDLKKGGTVATLDPAKKDVNDYRVRTPKGVAVARGTVFAVRVTQDQSNATLTTMSGTVTFVTERGEVTVSIGQTSSGSGVMSVAQAVAANPELAQSFVEAATSIAAAVGAGTVNNSSGTPNNVNTVLAALVDVAAQAAPGQAADIARSVFAAAAPGLGANGAATALLITQAAVGGAAKVDPTNSQARSTQVAEAVASAANSASISVDAKVLAGAAQGGAGEVTAETPILPPLDQTQVVVSPSRP